MSLLWFYFSFFLTCSSETKVENIEKINHSQPLIKDSQTNGQMEVVNCYLGNWLKSKVENIEKINHSQPLIKDSQTNGQMEVVNCYLGNWLKSIAGKKQPLSTRGSGDTPSGIH